MNSCILGKYWQKIGNGRRSVECVNSGRMIVVNMWPVGRNICWKKQKYLHIRVGFNQLLNGNEMAMLRES